jgi:hypothetical protein
MYSNKGKYYLPLNMWPLYIQNLTNKKTNIHLCFPLWQMQTLDIAFHKNGIHS